MIQFNLLPEVKLEYIKARRIKRMVIGVSVLASGVALFVFVVLLLTVHFVQTKNIHDLTDDINANYKKIQKIDNINQMLTVQGQLNSLPGLHNDKPVASRLFTYLSQLTPKEISISDITVDFTQNTMVINGSSSSLNSVNAFVDSLKYTTYSTDASSDKKLAFSQVVLTNFSRSDKTATYSISLSFDPTIFQSDATGIKLIVGGADAKQELNSIIFKKEVQ